MRWYLNDTSLQAQFADPAEFVDTLHGLLALRQRFEVLRRSFFVTPSVAGRFASHQLTVRELLRQPAHRQIQALVLRWLDRGGPFVDDDRLQEVDDYFEFESEDVTNGGLGEAARRVKAMEAASTFSFQGGTINFARSPLPVFHGLAEARLGQYQVSNLWTLDALQFTVLDSVPAPRNWRELIETARGRFPRLWLPDEIYLHHALAREAFDSIIADRTVALLEVLDQYMQARRPDGSEETVAQTIVQEHFTGDRAAFSGESATNRQRFKDELSFADPASPNIKIFAHWHGKISHRYFRLHFEWPVPAAADRLKVVYLGPKITRD